jgi:hypothetical protein
MKVLVAGLLLLALGGCSVVSERPLFNSSQASALQLADGLWAMSGPGCDVGPSPAVAPLPECAAPVVIAHGRMKWDTAATMAKVSGGVRLPLPPTPDASDFLLVDGDPLIVQMTNGSSNSFSPGPAGAPDQPAAPPLKPGYLALKRLDVNARGEIDRAVIWPVSCPDHPAHAAGFTLDGLKCVALTQDAVRGQARHMKPFLSAFLTWIRAAPG